MAVRLRVRRRNGNEADATDGDPPLIHLAGNVTLSVTLLAGSTVMASPTAISTCGLIRI
jgi:hypothetical protein